MRRRMVLWAVLGLVAVAASVWVKAFMAVVLAPGRALRKLPRPHPPFGHLLPSREKADTQCSRLDSLLPLWEKVPKGRMRGGQ